MGNSVSVYDRQDPPVIGLNSTEGVNKVVVFDQEGKSVTEMVADGFLGNWVSVRNFPRPSFPAAKLYAEYLQMSCESTTGDLKSPQLHYTAAKKNTLKVYNKQTGRATTLGDK